MYSVVLEINENLIPEMPGSIGFIDNNGVFYSLVGNIITVSVSI